MSNGADEVQKKLRNQLKDYIETQYLGKTPILAKNLDKMLSSEGILFREPYIEASPAYVTEDQGLATAKIPNWEKDFLKKLADEHLGVFKKPFVHQIESLEAAAAGKDIFVSTGTGSGKTECFMWPLLVKLANEARNSEQTWNQRGVRAIIMYPMNALVSDQISRLRRIVGDPKGKFANAFRAVSFADARRPQFGMYTGRTPYSGSHSIKNDMQLADTLQENLLDEEDLDYREQLLKSGKIPAKKNLAKFISNLKQGNHITDPEDAELITRIEMQNNVPDILITNYSMLEYMLFRPQEAKIWEETKKWLDSDKNNKLLFIIDEAHMYSGSAGGEVAYLIKRLFHHLKISREKVQFILTTASMPKEREDDIHKFACELTSAPVEHEFVRLNGHRKKLIKGQGIQIEAKEFNSISMTNLESGDKKLILDELNQFWNRTSTKSGFSKYDNLPDLSEWMYDNLTSFAPFYQLFNACRGEAVSLSELATNIFGSDSDQCIRAVDVMLELTPFARNKYTDEALFPARMHMMFRGINGIFACSNPACPDHVTDGGLTLGRLILSDGIYLCPSCGSVVYEIYNDRRCGALFFRGFITGSISNKKYFWHDSGNYKDGTVKEVQLFIPDDNFERGRKDVSACYLNVKNGYLYFDGDDRYEKNKEYRKLYYSSTAAGTEERDITFGVCPFCDNKFGPRGAISFSTRGNQSFDELIKTQFSLEPAVDDAKYKNTDRFPNQGRKVLLFSDSRQKAAKLTLDMANASERSVMRQLMARAIVNLENGQEQSLNNIYLYYLKELIDHDLSNLVNDDRKIYDKVKKRLKRKGIDWLKERAESYQVDKASDFVKESLIRLYCGSYNTYYDTAVSWLKPSKRKLNLIIDELIDEDIDYDDDKIEELICVWIMLACDEKMALGNEISDLLRGRVRNFVATGIETPFFGKYLFEDSFGENAEKVADIVTSSLTVRRADDKLFISLDNVTPCLDWRHQWYRCDKCKEVSPFKIQGKCPRETCDGTLVKLTEADLKGIKYWRQPIIDALNGAKLNLLDVEEHTAQLSNKDNTNDYWSTGEKYELEFQDILKDGEKPVDILSSTTTMEVGIDIGSLVGVGLRNVPPKRENYQQRAGRAGRRGASLSTIVTFCERGPHDSLYFNDPAPMFRGDPRKPWIDVASPKIIERHLSLVALVEYLKKLGLKNSIDKIKISDFLENYLVGFADYLEKWTSKLDPILLNDQNFDRQAFMKKLSQNLFDIKARYQEHPELFAGEYNRTKNLLDVAFEDGIIPSYSFPKNLVYTYLSDKSGKIENKVDRSLDIAISEYAPGRTIVVNKKTYQIGGFASANPTYKEAEKYLENDSFAKTVYTCPKCGWFGLIQDGVTEGEKCQFCGKGEIVASPKKMLRPWGFAPKDGKEISSGNVMEEVTMAQQPIYSTLPKKAEIEPLNGSQHIRIASRKNQRIIMLNTGSKNEGFEICKLCGASMPGNTKEALKSVKSPTLGSSYKKTGNCSHSSVANVDLGYDFITDMLVLEFELDNSKINTNFDNPWHTRAGCSLAEAIRLGASQLLDIDFTELVAGSRFRKGNESSFIDVYIYDSLLSGAGYSASLKGVMPKLLQKVKNILEDCNCDSSCYNCLRNYRNQFMHGLLDRFAAKELLKWGLNGTIRADYSEEEQETRFKPLASILRENDHSINGLFVDGKRVRISPSMKMVDDPTSINVSDYLIKYARPIALEQIELELQDE
ncbi:DEAD/DEAH box helicase [Lactobacillus nasalidis]|uniref:DEAD/DEAH box helicase n=1 Tax=Lactobacillus nasalidis TaxID=2797258 RepID=UPI0019166F6B|nr:DEAD/DEAH box helicase [Lactobacillus nasalidis]GHV97609.1 hypothetical protein lacNasYZ01_07910 [Lactobacillus nasalidis]GHV98826.1 hypothetical protein lacNasYZ02_02560 [Lactobacillus nasalidis]